MVFEVSTWNYLKQYGGGADLHRAIGEIRENGFGVELWLDWTADPGVFLRRNYETLKEWTTGMESVTVHSRLLYDSSETVIQEEIELCGFLGGGVAVFHPKAFNFPVGALDFEAASPQSEEAYGLLLRSVKFAADRNVTLALENGPLDFMREALKKVSSLRERNSFGICFDTSHAHMHSARYPNPAAEYISALGDSIVHVHASDNHGKKDDHLPPGTGTIDWKDLLARLDRAGYAGGVVLELAAENPAETAVRSRAFLRGLMGKV